MNPTLTPERAKFNYNAYFAEPSLEDSSEKPRIVLIKKFLKNFGLRLNDLKFDGNSGSDRFISFSRFYGACYFAVSYGLEEVSATIDRPNDVNQVRDLLIGYYNIFQHNKVGRQKIGYQIHCGIEGDLKQLLEMLNSSIPENLVESSIGRGTIYDLKITEHNLIIHVLMANSLVLRNRLYLSFEFDFNPNIYTFKEAFETALKVNKNILKSYNMTLNI